MESPNPWNPANAAKELLRRRKARRSLLDFTTYTKPDYRVNWHHKALTDALDRVIAGDCKRLMVFMPPQHGKSELVSRRFPAYIFGCDPNTRLIQSSYAKELAADMNRACQRIMMSDAYRRLFPHVRIDTRGTRSATLDARRTMSIFEIPGYRGSLRSAGVGCGIAGNPADGAIIDDPFGKREDANSPVIRQKVWDWYANDLYSRLSTDAWIVLTHTRWHRDDLAGRLLREMMDKQNDQWEVLCLPAIREEGPGDSRDPRKSGEPLWPSFKSAADIEIIRRQDAKTYAALYQQDPADATSAEWHPSNFGEFIWVQPDKWPKREFFDWQMVCVDASKGKSDKQGDYSAIVSLGLGKDRLLYVDAILDRIPLNQLVRKIVLFCDEKRPDAVGIEAEQFQELLVHEFKRQCGAFFTQRWPIYGVMTGGLKKVFRIRRLSQYITNREFRFKADSPGCRLLVDQLMDFPLADHDDGPDALDMCRQLPYDLEAV